MPTASPSPDRPRADPGAGSGEGASGPDRLVTLAVVTGAHGVRGEVRLKLFTDDLGRYASFNGGALRLEALRGGVARFAGVADRTAGEALRGTALTVPRSALPPLDDGEYYYADLIGLPVVTPDGQAAGRVVSVENFGAGDVVEIERADGRRVMLPMTPAAVPSWDAERLVAEPAFLDAS